MAMIQVQVKKDICGRQQFIYYDTDDLSQEDYCEFRRLEKEGKPFEALKFLSYKVNR